MLFYTVASPKEVAMVNITRILVPTDFSAASDSALTYARSLARQFGASINLVHVLEDPFASGAFVGDGVVAMPPDLRESLERAAREQLTQRHAEHAGTLPLSSMDLLTGSAARRIVEHAEATGANLIVMGTHGRGGLGHLLLGSIAEKVVRTAKCPVLTAREPQPETVSV
jgi:universal stress protein A